MRSAPLPTKQAEVPGVARIEAHRGDLRELEAVWTALEDPAHPGAAFRSFPWISSWWKHFSANREAVVLLARRGEDVVGILPLYAEPLPLGGRSLRLMGDNVVGSDYLGVVTRDPTLQQLFIEHLRAGAGADEVVLDGLLRDDPITAGFSQVEHRYRCPYVSTRGAFDAYLGGLADGVGTQLHRRRKWLEKRPGYAIECLTSPEDMTRAMDALFALHHARWAIEGGSDGIDSPVVEAFHRDAARALAERGWSRVYVMTVEGAPRAALYGWRHGRTFAFYQSGHEPAWRPRSVGTVLLGHIIGECFADDAIDEFDFLRGSEEYKFKWATAFRETVRVRARAAGLRPWLTDCGREAYRQLREAAKGALPPQALDWMRRARKQMRAAT